MKNHYVVLAVGGLVLWYLYSKRNHNDQAAALSAVVTSGSDSAVGQPKIFAGS